MNKHSKINLGPSSAHRWLECPASVRFIVENADKLPDETTEFAQEGTLAHEYASKWLKMSVDFTRGFIKEYTIPEITDTDMLKHCLNYIDLVRNRIRNIYETHIEIESKVPLWYLPERNGYIDCAIADSKNRTLEIIDLKYGMGVSVDAVRNPQLMIYAESFIRADDFYKVDDDWEIKLTIFQPRDRSDNLPPIRTWSLTRAELSAFSKIIEDLSQVILDETSDLPFVPNPEHQCRFCPAQSICSAYAGHVLGVIPMKEEQLVLPNPNTFERSKRVKVLALKSALNAWLEALEEQELHELMNDAPEMGFKVVEGRTHRKWSDYTQAEAALKNLLGEDIYDEPKLISISEVEKRLKIQGKAGMIDALSQVITKPKGKLTLVPTTDKRESVNINLLSEFNNIDI